MKYLKYISLLSLIILVGCCNKQQVKHVITKGEQEALEPDEIIDTLKAGNERFVNGDHTPYDYKWQRRASAKNQYPIAAILSCLDSRVPVEIVFDQGIGDIFVGRVAGNIENKDILGSFEFATVLSGAKVIVVLGHSNCGAVKGAIDSAEVEKKGLKNLNYLLNNITPAVDAVLRKGERRSSRDSILVRRVMLENVKLTIERIRTNSDSLRTRENNGEIKIVGAFYELSTGEVKWFNDNDYQNIN